MSASFFATIDLPIVAGRPFTTADSVDSGPVAIVNEAFARRYLPGRSPLGARIAVRPQSGEIVEHEIVGVAQQIKGRPEESEPFAQLYLPSAQVPWAESNLSCTRHPDGRRQ